MVSTKVASRVFLTRSAIMSIALLSSISSQAVPPGLRYSAFLLRSGLTVSWKLAAPLGHSVPRLIGLSGLPSMLITWPSLTLISAAHPTAQYGQTLGTSLASAIFSDRACVAIGRKLMPRASAPPSPAPAFRNWRRLTGERVSSMPISFAIDLLLSLFFWEEYELLTIVPSKIRAANSLSNGEVAGRLREE